MAADYEFIGTTALNIPNGIFSFSASFEITIVSSLMSDVGTYLINIYVEDSEPKAVSTSFTVTITNTAPRLVNNILDQTMIHERSLNL